MMLSALCLSIDAAGKRSAKQRGMGPQSDLNALNGIQEEEAQALIKDVQLDRVLKRASWAELIEHLHDRVTGGSADNLGSPKRIPVSTQTVIANAFEILACAWLVGDEHTATLK